MKNNNLNIDGSVEYDYIKIQDTLNMKGTENRVNAENKLNTAIIANKLNTPNKPNTLNTAKGFECKKEDKYYQVVGFFNDKECQLEELQYNNKEEEQLKEFPYTSSLHNNSNLNINKHQDFPSQNNFTLNSNLNKNLNKNKSININKKKTAFSLIELSIVLIIIGLLVAGITGGASLIKSAELRSAMNEIRNYQLAVNTYYAGTGKLPGTNTSQMDFEKTGQAVADMVNEGILDVKLDCFSGSAGSYVCNDKSVNKNTMPNSKIKGAGYAFGYNTQMGDNIIFILRDGVSENLISCNTSTCTDAVQPVLSNKDAYNLDSKLDDGVRDSGKFMSFSADSLVCNYDTKNDKNCVSAIGIGL